MPETPMPRTTALISVQATYNLYQADSGAVACDEVINIPLAYVVAKQVRMNKRSYLIVPVVEFNAPLMDIDFSIVTNEGVIVEPFLPPGRSEEANPYEGERFYFVLPRGTTGIKDVVISHNIPNALEYGIMPPPYNYDNALFGVITSAVGDNSDRIAELENFTPRYGYKMANGEHKVNFSIVGSPIAIKYNTHFITFSIVNSASTDVNFSFYISKVGDASERMEATLTLKPGQSVIKIDLLTLIVYVRGTNSLLVNDTYSLTGLTSHEYAPIAFGYTLNDKILGEQTLYEWK